MINTIPNEVVEIPSTSEFNEMLNKFQNQLIIVTFYTETCPICKSFAPAFTGVQKELSKYNVFFGRANLNQMPIVGEQFNIMGVPTTIFVKNKEIVLMRSGGFPKTQFRQMVEEVLWKFFNIKVKKPADADTMYM